MSEKTPKSTEFTEQSHALETRSIASITSSRSRSSSASIAATKARAKLEAAQARAAYVKKESEVMIEKAQLKVTEARMEATLAAIKQEGEVAAAMAEMKVLEAAAECVSEDRKSEVNEVPERVQNYIQCQAEVGLVGSLGDEPHQPPLEHIVCELRAGTPLRQHRPRAAKDEVPYERLNDDKRQQPQKSAPTINHLPFESTPQPACNKDANTSEIARYLARRELLNSGLTKFDDCPENYWAWRSSFMNALEGLHLSASEQLDLMSRWLGEQSAHQVRRIRAVHVGNPTTGLRKAWERLEECYGSPEVIEKSLFDRIDNFPKISNKDPVKLRELGDLLQEVESAKYEGYLPGLTYLDTARGVAPIVDKLPYSLQEKWMTQGSQYKAVNHVAFPPFTFFCEFICREARTRNDPSFAPLAGTQTSLKLNQPARGPAKSSVFTRKTEVSLDGMSQASDASSKLEDVDRKCPLHKKPHPLTRCRGFRSKPLAERKAFLKENGICFRCCATVTHLARNCRAAIKCMECGSDAHVSALHPGSPSFNYPPTEHGGEREAELPQSAVTSKHTGVHGDGINARSCSKICLTKVYPEGYPSKAIKLYAILDDQSNRSLARTEFFDLMNVKGVNSAYTLHTCSGTTETTGRRATGFIVESLDGRSKMRLPTLIECNNMPNDRTEIPTPEAARGHAHLRPIAHHIPLLDPEAKILLLLGRDILQVHKVREKRNGPSNTPYAQRLDLGWVIVGDVCLGPVHKPAAVSTYHTHILDSGRPTMFSPCPNQLRIKEKLGDNPLPNVSLDCDTLVFDDVIGSTIFTRSEHDDKIGLSIEDRLFLDIMDKEMCMNDSNSWVAPLPFKIPRKRLPNNRDQALTRLKSLLCTLDKKSEMKTHFFTFMRNIFERSHAEEAPPLLEGQECWYLPLFGVYHPQKPGQIRVVFDSSAQTQGISLNDVLLTGPDLNNSLLGVLLRFRREPVAVTADIEQMFHSFIVKEEDRDFLRFFWFRDNDSSKEIIEYRMRVHIFGNSPSPAVAIYGLRRAAKHGEEKYGSDVLHFVEREFYVDDGILSMPTAAEAIDILTRTQKMLADSNLRLHKFASNSEEVIEAFPTEDCAKGLKDLHMGVDSVSIQRSLGLSWNLKKDIFTFRVAATRKPFTRRGVLATVNSLFDPLGFATPVTIQGKFLLRELSSEALDWDSPFPEDKEEGWNTWRKSLHELERLEICRSYISDTLSTAQRKELHIFSDASTKAVAAVAYLRVVDEEGTSHIGFVLGKAKLAPQAAHTIPRLELGAAVLAAEIAETIISEIDITLDATEFYTDSRVVLGYIYNQTRRFYMYVANRVQRIRKVSCPSQWHYVSTRQNPADHATRSVPAALLTSTTWLTGPAFLSKVKDLSPPEEKFDLIDPDTDKEIRSLITAVATKSSYLESQRFERFSSWKSLLRAMTSLIHIVQSCKTAENQKTSCRSWHHCTNPRTVEELSQATAVIIKSVQQEAYEEELDCIAKGQDMRRDSTLSKLNPHQDEEGLLRVGGRLKHSVLDYEEKFPVIIPRGSHIAKLLVEHYHTRVSHQGRILTEAAVRSAGYWIVGVRRLVNSIIHKCVTCKKLRGKATEQKMADLPADRLSTEPPFTNVGLDVFGPWTVVARRTRGGQALSKRWAVLFTCLSTRAIHIELIDSMDSSTFINALRRFFALRGPVKQIRSDCGTNFIGACKELEIILTEPHESNVKRHLSAEGCSWVFTPPHASHMGGAWERMIGVARRILDSMLLQTSPSRLTHDVLSTFMAEVTGIVNSRPLTSISTDPELPFLLTPAMLLTQKSCTLRPPPGDFREVDIHRQQWRQVQHLANTFWSRWKHEYLATLQSRNKWQKERRNLKEGDVVLLKDAQAKRNDWPIALVTKAIACSDGKVRKVELRVSRHGIFKSFLRPVSETVLLMSTND